ncbi:MAG: IS200/IS605 family element transposase accessory protein TnpB [Firmicutes bacterium]|nr:IS200/IS605 family element transposase accessory protein TnpB [Bacillota bacterium]
MSNRTFEFRIYPNRVQCQLIDKTFGCTRLVYNHCLDRKKQLWQDSRQSLSYTACAKELTQLKKENEFLKEVDSIALQQSLRHLDTAYRNFFARGNKGFPRFKSKKNGRQSYSTVNVNNNIRLEDGRIRLPKLGKVKIRQHRQIPEGWILKSATIKRVPSGKYYVSILFEYENQARERKADKVLGLDFSLPELFVTSEGEHCGYPKYYRQAEQKLAKAQRKLSKMQKGSSNYGKQRVKVARIHEKVANQRKDFLHKQSHWIAKAYDAVCIEKLNMQEMSKLMNFGKSVHDDGWGMFTRMLEYKLEDRGGRLVRIDRWYPSSQTCSCCGHIHPEMKDLKVRVLFCDWCLEYYDRDENAAINIREEGHRLLKRQKLQKSA